MTEQKAINTLRRLYRIADAGERGFATAACNVDSPALVILFKMYAQQRLNFKNEIFAELSRLGDTVRPGASLPGAVHRGRVAIFAAMSDGDGDRQERVILKEAALGEKAAEREYRSALEQSLPGTTREMVERQYQEVREAGAIVRCLRDDEQRRAGLHLARSEQDTRRAVQALASDGFNPGEIETMKIDDRALYDGRGATQAEILLSGIVGGVLWGGLMGLLAGFGVVATINPPGTAAAALAWVLTALGFLLMGAFISGVLALFISAGVTGRDGYRYPEIRENARYLVHAMACVPID